MCQSLTSASLRDSTGEFELTLMSCAGWVILGSMLALVLTAIRWLPRRYFAAFFRIHVTLALVAGLATLAHGYGATVANGAMPASLPGVGIWLLDIVLRLCFMNGARLFVCRLVRVCLCASARASARAHLLVLLFARLLEAWRPGRMPFFHVWLLSAVAHSSRLWRLRNMGERQGDDMQEMCLTSADVGCCAAHSSRFYRVQASRKAQPLRFARCSL